MTLIKLAETDSKKTLADLVLAAEGYLLEDDIPEAVELAGRKHDYFAANGGKPDAQGRRHSRAGGKPEA